MIHGTSLRQLVEYPIRALSAMVVIAWVLMSGTVAEAQTLTTVHEFCIDDTCATGAAPTSLIQAADGRFAVRSQSAPPAKYRIG
jgi:hypothetical protein